MIYFNILKPIFPPSFEYIWTLGMVALGLCWACQSHVVRLLFLCVRSSRMQFLVEYGLYTFKPYDILFLFYHLMNVSSPDCQKHISTDLKVSQE